jgi:hypothetical protein
VPQAWSWMDASRRERSISTFPYYFALQTRCLFRCVESVLLLCPTTLKGLRGVMLGRPCTLPETHDTVVAVCTYEYPACLHPPPKNCLYLSAYQFSPQARASLWFVQSSRACPRRSPLVILAILVNAARVVLTDSSSNYIQVARRS